MVHGGDCGVRGEGLGDRLGRRALAGDAQVERLDALQDLVRVERREGGAEVVHVLGLHERPEREALPEPLPERLRPEPVVRGGELRPARGVGAEVEGSEVDRDAAERGAMAAQELRGGVHHEVGAVLAGTDQVRGADRAVDHEGDARGVRDVGDRADVENLGERVRDGLREEQPGAFVRRRAPGLRVVLVDEGHRDPEVVEGVLEQIDRASVEPVGGDDMAAAAREREDRDSDRGLPAGDGDRGDAALERRDALLEQLLRGAGVAAVDVARATQREQVARLGQGTELVGGRLVQRGHGRVLRRSRDVRRLHLLRGETGVGGGGGGNGHAPILGRADPIRRDVSVCCGSGGVRGAERSCRARRASR